MCKCNSGKRNHNGTQIRQVQSDNVIALYYKPGQVKPIKVFDSADISARTKFLGTASHGYPISVPRNLVGVERSDGSKFVLPEEFILLQAIANNGQNVSFSANNDNEVAKPAIKRRVIKKVADNEDLP